MLTCGPTPGGGSAPPGCARTSPLWNEYERRRQQPSDIQDHLLELFTWARGWPGPRGARILEIGVCTGNSTSAFLAALEIERKGCLWSIDLGPRHPDIPDGWEASGHWQVLWEHSLSEAARAWAPREVDVLFIDSGHQYELTFGELMLHGPRVARGGVILLHDTENPNESGMPACGPHDSPVGRAIDTYCAVQGLEWVNRPGCGGLGVVRVR